MELWWKYSSSSETNQDLKRIWMSTVVFLFTAWQPDTRYCCSLMTLFSNCKSLCWETEPRAGSRFKLAKHCLAWWAPAITGMRVSGDSAPCYPRAWSDQSMLIQICICKFLSGFTWILTNKCPYFNVLCNWLGAFMKQKRACLLQNYASRSSVIINKHNWPL